MLYYSTHYRVTLTSNSLRCIQVIAGVLGRAGEAGQKQRLAAAAKGKITYRPATNLVLPETPENAEAAAALKAAGKAGQDSVEDIMNTDEISAKMEEVNNGEDHRLKGGRDIKASS